MIDQDTIEIEIPFIRQYIKQVLASDKRYIDLWGGRGRGGSHFATQLALLYITSPAYFRGYFVRRTKTDIRDSLFKDFKDRVEESEGVTLDDFYINEQAMHVVYLPTGNEIISKGVVGEGKRTAKMKSLAGATHVFIEEADELTEDEFNQLDLSLRSTKTRSLRVVRIFNPPFYRHWIWRDYVLNDSEVPGYFTATVRPDADVCSVFGTYKTNIANINDSSIALFESFKEQNEEYYYTVIKGLISEGARGRIYKGWKGISLEEYNQLPYPEIYGLDFGYSEDPVALVGVKMHNKKLWFRKLIYQVGLTNGLLAEKMTALGIDYHSDIIADCAEPKSIGELRLLGFGRVLSCVKGPDSINYGINQLKGDEVHFVHDKDIEMEYAEYKWHIGSDKVPTNVPIDKHNHIMDALRYARMHKNRLGND